MTPRTFWDQDGYLWEESLERPDLIRSVWSLTREESLPSLGWTSTWWPRAEAERVGLVLVASC